jgi:hypothetical protein
MYSLDDASGINQQGRYDSTLCSLRVECPLPYFVKVCLADRALDGVLSYRIDMAQGRLNSHLFTFPTFPVPLTIRQQAHPYSRPDQLRGVQIGRRALLCLCTDKE